MHEGWQRFDASPPPETRKMASLLGRPVLSVEMP
jgi:hypothetical protein